MADIGATGRGIMQERNISTLLKMSIRSIIDNVEENLDEIERLPLNIKNRILNLMSKRGTLTDSNIHKLLNTGLYVLDLSESDVTDKALVHLRKCPHLKKIDLNSAKISRTDITTPGILSIAQYCHKLQAVYLRRCLNITDEAVVAIAQSCPDLKELNIGGCKQITDRSLEALGQNSRNLKCIDTSKTNITDMGVYNLVSGCPSQTLKEVHISGCVNLTDEAVEAVTQMCPKINLLIFHGCPKMTEQSRMALEELSFDDSRKMKQVTWTVY